MVDTILQKGADPSALRMFLNALKEDPESAVNRAGFADWLQEQGIQWGEVINLGIREQTMGYCCCKMQRTSTPRQSFRLPCDRCVVLERMEYLLPVVSDYWNIPLIWRNMSVYQRSADWKPSMGTQGGSSYKSILETGFIYFRGGLPHSVHCAFRDWLNWGPSFYRFFPTLQNVWIHDREPVVREEEKGDYEMWFPGNPTTHFQGRPVPEKARLGILYPLVEKQGFRHCEQRAVSFMKGGELGYPSAKQALSRAALAWADSVYDSQVIQTGLMSGLSAANLMQSNWRGSAPEWVQLLNSRLFRQTGPINPYQQPEQEID